MFGLLTFPPCPPSLYRTVAFFFFLRGERDLKEQPVQAVYFLKYFYTERTFFYSRLKRQYGVTEVEWDLSLNWDLAVTGCVTLGKFFALLSLSFFLSKMGTTVISDLEGFGDN